MIFRAVLVLLLLIGPAGATPPTLDTSIGIVTDSANDTDTITSLNVFSNAGSEVLVVTVGTEVDSAAAPSSVVSMTASGLTFTRRAGVTNGSGVCRFSDPCTIRVEVWWAPLASTLASTTITTTFDTAAHLIDVQWATFSGTADYTSPWDTNVVLPASNTGNAGIAFLNGFQTSQTDDAVFSFTGLGRNDTIAACTPSPNSGWNDYGQARLSNALGLESTFFRVTSLQSFNTNFALNRAAFCPAGDGTDGDAWVVIMDALTGTAVTPPATTKRPWVQIMQ